jgi:hypothetical protein
VFKFTWPRRLALAAASIVLAVGSGLLPTAATAPVSQSAIRTTRSTAAEVPVSVSCWYDPYDSYGPSC